MSKLGVIVETTAPPSLLQKVSLSPANTENSERAAGQETAIVASVRPRGPCGDTRGISLLRKLKSRESIVFIHQIVNVTTLSKIQFIH